MTAEAITFDELLRAMEDARPEHSDGFTVQELCRAKQVSPGRARNIVRLGIERGMLTVTHKSMADISGRIQSVPAYVFVRKGKTRRS